MNLEKMFDLHYRKKRKKKKTLFKRKAKKDWDDTKSGKLGHSRFERSPTRYFLGKYKYNNWIKEGTWYFLWTRKTKRVRNTHRCWTFRNILFVQWIFYENKIWKWCTYTKIILNKRGVGSKIQITRDCHLDVFGNKFFLLFHWQWIYHFTLVLVATISNICAKDNIIVIKWKAVGLNINSEK